MTRAIELLDSFIKQTGEVWAIEARNEVVGLVEQLEALREALMEIAAMPGPGNAGTGAAGWLTTHERAPKRAQEALDAASFPAISPHPCPKGDDCALNKGAVECFHCGRKWPQEQSPASEPRKQG